MKILAIETSCDDTCIALAEYSTNNFKLISNLISSQTEIHQKWGGVYPSLARREHQRNLVPLLEKALLSAFILEKKKVKIKLSALLLRRKKMSAEEELVLKKILERENLLSKKLKKFLEKYPKPKIDLIAVTIGPGLDPCLWTGVNLAKALSYYWKTPIMGINHIEAHLFANWIESSGQKLRIQDLKDVFPAISLIVSGGHTQLILIEKYENYKILGETRDDAAGEAFDKIARILGLGYPGGPAIAAAATKSSIFNNKLSIKLPRPMLNTKNYDFSFSGLKTAVLYNYKKQPKKERESKRYIRTMACETQQAIIDVLIKKTIKAAKDYSAKSIILSGGVAANNELRKQLQTAINNQQSIINFFVPLKNLCTDNAAMIAVTAYLKTIGGQAPDNWQKITAQPNLRIA